MRTTLPARAFALLAVAAALSLTPDAHAAEPYVVASGVGFPIGQSRELVSGNGMIVNDGTPGSPTPTLPYPSTTATTGSVGTITDVDVTLAGFKHQWPADVDILLESPSGTTVTLMSDVGGTKQVGPVGLHFDDQAASAVPNDTLETGDYRPTDVDGLYGQDTFPVPAPQGTPASALAAFIGQSPYGTWRLYVVDDAPVGTGTIDYWTVDVHTTGQATYPSTITVTGGPQSIADVDVTLTGLEHRAPADLDVLLVGPGGQQVTLTSDAGGGTALAATDLVLDDEAGSPLLEDTPITPGRYRPTDVVQTDPDLYPAPAPASTGNTSLSVFDGTDANGVWQLFVQDDLTGARGSLGGWALSFAGAGVPVPPVVTPGGGGGIAPDTTAPRVSAWRPARSATRVRRDVSVVARMSEAVAPGSVNGSAAFLKAVGSTHRVRAAVRVRQGAVVIVPRRPLAPRTTCRVVLTTAIRDLAGNRLDQDPSRPGRQRATWTFTTR